MNTPLVDVVVPCFGKSNLVIRCVGSLKRQKRLGEIIIVDDGSPDDDATVLKTLETRYYRNAGSDGFPASCNRGVKKSDSKYILILNSDTEATLDNTIEIMARNLDDGAAVCGAMLLYPKAHPYAPERIQHAGVAFALDGYPYHIHAGRHPGSPAATKRKSINAVTGACLMTTRDWWDKIGGFNEKIFGRGVFEDVDLCLTVKKLGGEVIYEPESVWYHWEHASQGQNGNWFTRDYLHGNFQRLLLKWGMIPCDDNIWYK